RVDAARVGKLARVVAVARVVDAFDVLGGVEPLDRPAGNCRDGRRPLGRLLQRRLRGGALPPLLAACGDGFHPQALSLPRSVTPVVSGFSQTAWIGRTWRPTSVG